MASGQTRSSIPQHFDTQPDTPAHIKLALRYLGTRETVMIRGKKASNPQVQRWIEVAGGGRDKDTVKTPWCAYFHDAILEQSGIASMKSGMARPHARWGQEVDLDNEDDWRVGDSVVFIRLNKQGKDDGVLGHIAFLLWWDDTNVYCVGGNQGDSVCIAAFPRDRIIAIRRQRGVLKSKTIQKSVGSAAAEIGSQVAEKTIPNWQTHVDTAADLAENIRSPLEVLSQYKPWITGVLSTLAILLALWAAYHRFVDHKDGKNT